MDAYDEIGRRHQKMDRVLVRFFGSNLLPYKRTELVHGFSTPVSDIRETESGVIAYIELPGTGKEDIDLSITDDSIEVKAENREEKKKGGMHSYRMSRFYRKLPLPAEVDADKAKASFRDGILKLEIPKQKSVEHRKRIPIE